jgi:hypothetical protein
MQKRVSLPQASIDIERSLALVCALPEADHSERRATAAQVIERATTVHGTPDGVRLVFEGSSDTARIVVEFALAERECCSQFAYRITFDPHAAGVELRVTAPDSLVEPLQRLYAGLTATPTHA